MYGFMVETVTSHWDPDHRQPGSLSGLVALVATTLGVIATFALEVPTTIRVARGGPLPNGGVFADETGHPKAADCSER